MFRLNQYLNLEDSTLFINRGSGHGPCHVLEPISVLKSPNIQEFLMHPAWMQRR